MSHKENENFRRLVANLPILPRVFDLNLSVMYPKENAAKKLTYYPYATSDEV